MINDILSAQLNFEDPSGHSSTKLYFRQTADNSGGGPDGFELADSLDANLSPLILAALSDDFELTGIICRKHFDDPEAQTTFTTAAQSGLGSGPGLPSNNSILFGLKQSLFPVKQNGRLFMPGIPEINTEVGLLAPAYQAGVLTAIGARLILPFASPTDTGIYEFGMISQKVLNAAPPAKDWAGAFAVVNSVSVSPVIAIQRRRTTKVVGGVS